MTQPLLRLKGITKRFGDLTANHAVDLDIRAGEIMALLGENGAGKSTLCNIVSGMLQADAGEIQLRGEAVEIDSPRAASSLGIGMVHQHFMLVPTMTVVENIALGLPSRRPPLLELDRIGEDLMTLSRDYGLDVDSDVRVEDLSVGQQQRVEIMKVLYRNADVLLLDEPTAVLTPQEWRQLEQVLRDLAEDGRAIVIVTHKLEEALEVADRCAVLRDGEMIATVDVADTDKPDLARLMVGREVVIRVNWPRLEPGATILEVEGLRLLGEDGRRVLDDVSLDVREREVVGVAGVDGNGQAELVAALTGLAVPEQGSVSLGPTRLEGRGPLALTEVDGAVIPGDRQAKGLALPLTIRDNLIMKDYRQPKFSHYGMLHQDHIEEHAAGLVRAYDIRAPGSGVAAEQLSGGNQQKVVIARELDRNPRLLIAEQPTRGLDVGAVEFVYTRILKHKQSGGATLLISTELDEILSLSDRVAVIYDGRLSPLYAVDEVDVEQLGLLMAGQTELDS